MSASGYVDLQINGYAGVDFNQDHLSLSDLTRACETLQRDGVAGILATIITDSIPAMTARLQRIVDLRSVSPVIEQMIWGLHIEGPFISQVPGYVGAHPKHQARPGNWDDMGLLLDAADGLTRIVTLAPEQDSRQILTRKLTQQGIIVAAGHTNATLRELNACIDAGLCLFTHLGNGCPMEMNRHDNIIQRALSRSDALWYSFIADGAHVPFFALQNYLKIVGLNRAIVVTDAIAAAGCGPGRYRLGDQVVDVGEDGVPRATDHSHLVGSGTIMSRMDANLAEHLDMSPRAIERLTRDNPLTLLGRCESAPPVSDPTPARVLN